MSYNQRINLNEFYLIQNKQIYEKKVQASHKNIINMYLFPEK